MNFKIHPRIEALLAEKFPELVTDSTPISRLKALAKMILEASNEYIQNPDDQTPWDLPSMQTAQWLYFLPLNNVRAQGVVSRLRSLPEGASFFADLEQWVDFGAGLGALAYELEEVSIWKNTNFIESDPIPRAELKKQFPHAQVFSSLKSFVSSQERALFPRTLMTFSYSLTESPNPDLRTAPLLPPEAYTAEALLILEPSTQKDGRRLLELRQKLIEQGFHIWAPCLHQKSCPLLVQSHRDWCHDRFHFEPPSWFLRLEKELPIKNATLTTSYLAARKTPPAYLNSLSAKVRLIGDHLPEKGKSRQMICRGPEREFLAWLHRHVEPQEIPRGEILNLPTHFEKVSNEIRLQEPISLRSDRSATTNRT